MAVETQSIKQLYDDGMAEVFRIVGSLNATKAQRKEAKKTAEDLSLMLVTHTLQTIEGRTALLASLIVELNQVVASVETKPPYEDVLKNVTTILAKAQALYKDAKSSASAGV